MYDFHCNTMKPRYNENNELLMTDTDSLVYCINTEDFYKDMYAVREYFEMSGYSNKPLFMMKQIINGSREAFYFSGDIFLNFNYFLISICACARETQFSTF